MLNSRATTMTFILTMFVITSAIIGCMHAYPAQSNNMPDHREEVTWEMPNIYDSGLVTFKTVSYRPQITEDTVAELRADTSIPRGAFFYGVIDAIQETCITVGLQPTIDEIRAQTVIAQQHTGHVYTASDMALVIYNFTNTIGRYADDKDLYGCPEYWATPAETLWACKGDCEDFSILFVTLCRSFGLDAILFLAPEHVLAGVKADLQGVVSDGYTMAECTWHIQSRGEISDQSVGSDLTPIPFSLKGKALAGLGSYLESWGRFVFGIKDALISPINTEG